MLFTNVPTDPKDMKGRKQTKKAFKFQAESTARGHYLDIAEWRTEQARTACTCTYVLLHWCVMHNACVHTHVLAYVYVSSSQARLVIGPNRALFWDEGTRKDGTSFIAIGDFGMLPDGNVNRRFSGIVIPLTGKDGRTIAAAILAVCKRNGIERSYIPLSDSVSSTVGHKSGAIAFLRQEWKVRPLSREPS